MMTTANLLNSVIDPNREFPLETPEKCLELGNLAGERGDLELAMQWYIQGRKLAHKMNDAKLVKRFSIAIAMYL